MCVLNRFQLCLTLCDPLNCSPPDSCVHGILQARILEWGAIAFSKLGVQTLAEDCLSLNPSFVAYQLCDLGQVT